MQSDYISYLINCYLRSQRSSGLDCVRFDDCHELPNETFDSIKIRLDRIVKCHELCFALLHIFGILFQIFSRDGADSPFQTYRTHTDTETDVKKKTDL